MPTNCLFFDTNGGKGLSTSHVPQVLPLAFLAPDIIERILQGSLPLDLDTRWLMRLTSLPLDWREQRVMFGLPP